MPITYYACRFCLKQFDSLDECLDHETRHPTVDDLEVVDALDWCSSTTLWPHYIVIQHSETGEHHKYVRAL